jgi:hypothetical protein
VPRTCIVRITDVQGVVHAVTVSGETLFEAAAAAIGIFRQEKWAAEALTPNAILRIEVQLPPVFHDVPLKAVDRWASGSAITPGEQIAKRTIRDDRAR